MIVPRMALAWVGSSNTGSSPPQTWGSHSLGITSSGPIAIPVRKPSRSESSMHSEGDWSESKYVSRRSRSASLTLRSAAPIGLLPVNPPGFALSEKQAIAIQGSLGHRGPSDYDRASCARSRRRVRLPVRSAGRTGGQSGARGDRTGGQSDGRGGRTGDQNGGRGGQSAGNASLEPARLSPGELLEHPSQ